MKWSGETSLASVNQLLASYSSIGFPQHYNLLNYSSSRQDITVYSLLEPKERINDFMHHLIELLLVHLKRIDSQFCVIRNKRRWEDMAAALLSIIASAALYLSLIEEAYSCIGIFIHCQWSKALYCQLVSSNNPI